MKLVEGKLDVKLDVKLGVQMPSAIEDAISRGMKALCPPVPCKRPAASKNCRNVLSSSSTKTAIRTLRSTGSRGSSDKKHSVSGAFSNPSNSKTSTTISARVHRKHDMDVHSANKNGKSSKVPLAKQQPKYTALW